MKVWLAAVTIAVAVLLRFPPTRYGFYPRCPIFEAFGLLCPGCGATRAAAALLHGHLTEAWHWNALLVLAFFAGLLCLQARWRRGEWPQAEAWKVVSALAIAVVFSVVRNVG